MIEILPILLKENVVINDVRSGLFYTTWF